jgi:hypothetical protein
VTARMYTVRCCHCRTADVITATLDEAQQKRCGLCHQKLTVVGATHAPAGATLPMPDRERVTQHQDVTKKEADTARRLLVTAFEGKE